MWIEKGALGPIFAVKEVGKDLVFRGESPTKPWTKVCLHQRTGARISGPLHFGFSDPATQSAICATYNATELAGKTHTHTHTHTQRERERDDERDDERDAQE